VRSSRFAAQDSLPPWRASRTALCNRSRKVAARPSRFGAPVSESARERWAKIVSALKLAGITTRKLTVFQSARSSRAPSL